MQPAEEFERANLQTVRGRAPIKISLQREGEREEGVKNKPIAETCQHKNDGSGVSDSSDYLPPLVTLCVGMRLSIRGSYRKQAKKKK